MGGFWDLGLRVESLSEGYGFWTDRPQARLGLSSVRSFADHGLRHGRYEYL